ncbi:MAG: succinate dehydrogenase cytochrome b subunit [Bryobacteraceae bacterium]|nr:succinate dehydrogenase cytochrome b subunit [Bryobacteraceae bacterium]
MGLSFYSTANGKKTVMAVTGALLWLFVVAHLAGNLQVYLGPGFLDEYGRKLRELPALLWAARAGLLILAGLHIAAALQLWALKRKARPVPYAKKVATTSTWASRIMYWSGPVLLAFIVYHLLDLTLGVVNPGYEEGAVHANLVRSFSRPATAVFYLAAMAMLWAHLSHGIWSLFQTLGFSHPKYSGPLRTAAAAIAVLLAGGNMSIVLSVLLGIIR